MTCSIEFNVDSTMICITENYGEFIILQVGRLCITVHNSKTTGFVVGSNNYKSLTVLFCKIESDFHSFIKINNLGNNAYCIVTVTSIVDLRALYH